MASEGGHRPPVWIAVLVVPVIVAIALATFSWSAANLEPRDLPFGVAGPAQVTAPVAAKLSEQEGAFELHRYADEAAAVEAIMDREIYGAVVPAAGGPRLLTAPAASPTVAGLLQEGLAVPREKVTVVVPADPDDPRGTGFASLGLPLVLAGVIAGVVISLLGRPGLKQIGVLAATATASGLVTIAMAQGWLGIIGGPWLVNAGVVALTVFATAATVAGFKALIGPAGIGIAALLFVFVGNPWSGTGTAPEMLPKAAGFIGQLLPPGAAGQLLRNTAFFDGADSGGHVAVLLAWAVVGVGGILAGAAMRRRRPSTA